MDRTSQPQEEIEKELEDKVELAAASAPDARAESKQSISYAVINLCRYSFVQHKENTRCGALDDYQQNTTSCVWRHTQCGISGNFTFARACYSIF